jgi:hypothetical protein
VNWHKWLLAAAAAIIAMVLAALRSLVQHELEQSCRPFADWILRRAARLLPTNHQQHYLAEWRAELDTLGDRRLTAVAQAVSIRCFAVRLRRELLGTSSAHPRGVAWYSIGVSTTGLLVGAWWTVTDGVRVADTIDGRVLLLWGLSILHNSWTHPILARVGKIDRGGGSLFDYTLLLGWAAGVSVPAIMTAILLSHAIRHWRDRPTLGKALFNAAQFTLAATAAVWVLGELSTAPPAGPGQQVAVVGGMLAYAMVNTVLMRIAIALDRSSANLQALWSGWPMDIAEWILLAGLASASILAVHSLLGMGLLVALTVVYGTALAQVNDLVSPHIHLPQ